MEAKSIANQLYQAGKTKEAIAQYTVGVEMAEADTATAADRDCLHLLYCNRSVAHLDLAMVEEALQDAECAIEAHPDFAKAYARRASVLLDLFKYKDALADIAKAEDLATDDSLKDNLKLLSARATQKKWAANCYLKKQREEQKAKKCDYVLRFTDVHENGEEKVYEHLVKLQDAGFQNLLRTGFEEAFKNGSKKAVTKVYQMVCKATDGSNFKAKVGDRFDSLLRKQLSTEFGELQTEMSKHVELPPAPSSSSSWGSSPSPPYFSNPNPEFGKLPVALHESTYNATLTGEKYGRRRFYPGGPKWMDIPEFEKVVGLASRTLGFGLRLARENFKTQRDSDIAYRLLAVAYREVEGKTLTIKDHQAIYHKCGLTTFTRLPSNTVVKPSQIYQQQVDFQVQVGPHKATQPAGNFKCEACGDIIKDADPPECICGEIYCSDSCHKADWKDHHQICEQIEENQTLSFKFTELYWHQVLRGYFPLKDEPDFVSQWKATKRNDPVAELAFYMDVEMEMYLRKFQVAFDEFEKGKRGEFKNAPAKRALANHNFTAVASLQANRAQTAAAERDSVARLFFKRELLNHCYEISVFFQGSGLGEFVMPPRSNSEREFKQLLTSKNQEEVSLVSASLKAKQSAAATSAPTKKNTGIDEEVCD